MHFDIHLWVTKRRDQHFTQARNKHSPWIFYAGQANASFTRENAGYTEIFCDLS